MNIAHIKIWIILYNIIKINCRILLFGYSFMSFDLLGSLSDASVDVPAFIWLHLRTFHQICIFI